VLPGAPSVNTAVIYFP